jgi:hypothetical protein
MTLQILSVDEEKLGVEVGWLARRRTRGGFVVQRRAMKLACPYTLAGDAPSISARLEGANATAMLMKTKVEAEEELGRAPLTVGTHDVMISPSLYNRRSL